VSAIAEHCTCFLEPGGGKRVISLPYDEVRRCVEDGVTRQEGESFDAWDDCVLEDREARGVRLGDYFDNPRTYLWAGDYRQCMMPVTDRPLSGASGRASATAAGVLNQMSGGAVWGQDQPSLAPQQAWSARLFPVPRMGEVAGLFLAATEREERAASVVQRAFQRYQLKQRWLAVLGEAGFEAARLCSEGGSGRTSRHRPDSEGRRSGARGHVWTSSWLAYDRTVLELSGRTLAH